MMNVLFFNGGGSLEKTWLEPKGGLHGNIGGLKVEVLTIGLWVLCALFTNNQAKKKGLNTGLWTLIGLIFGVFGVIASLLARPRNQSPGTVTGTGGGILSASPSAFSGGVVGGAFGATAATRVPSGQQNAAEKIQEAAQQYLDEKEEEETDSGDFDFEA